jgi:hypothetical protein
LSLLSKLLKNTIQWAVWLDPDAGWMPRRIDRYTIRDNRSCRERGDCELVFLQRYEHIELVEAAEDVWFPVAAEETVFIPQLGDPTELVTAAKRFITIDRSTLRVNQALANGSLALAWPANTFVVDEVAGTGYHLGESAEKLIEVDIEKVRAQARADDSIELFPASSASPGRAASVVGPGGDLALQPNNPGRIREVHVWWIGIGCSLGLLCTLALIHRFHRGSGTR